MYIAWIWLAPIAYFFAAYMKPAMPGGAWFQVSVCLSNHCCNVYAAGVHTVHGHMHAVPKLHPSAICIYTGSYIYSIYFLWNATFLLASLFVQVHRALMLIALAFSVAGFILIFVALRNSGNPNGLITLGVSECGHFHC